jgi:hypothetical protein
LPGSLLSRGCKRTLASRAGFWTPRVHTHTYCREYVADASMRTFSVCGRQTFEHHVCVLAVPHTTTAFSPKAHCSIYSCAAHANNGLPWLVGSASNCPFLLLTLSRFCVYLNPHFLVNAKRKRQEPCHRMLVASCFTAVAHTPLLQPASCRFCVVGGGACVAERYCHCGALVCLRKNECLHVPRQRGCVRCYCSTLVLRVQVSLRSGRIK